MTTCLVKRILPFTLTFALGAAVAGLAGLFGSGGDEGARTFRRHYYGGAGGGCGAYRHKLVAESKPLDIHRRPAAFYTPEARQHRFMGTVRLRVTFGSDGVVKAVETLEGQPYGLTEAAERAAWRISFTPALENGLPISVTRTIEYSFPTGLTTEDF